MATNADTKISRLGPANTLTGTELVPMTQNINGVLTTVQATTQQIQQQLGISALNPILSGQAVINTGLAGPSLILNNTAGYAYPIAIEQSSIVRGYWGADATYSFRVLAANGSANTLLLDQFGNMTIPGGVVGRTTTPSAGNIGELLTASATAGMTTTNVAQTVVTLALTAGVWDVEGQIVYTNSVAGANQFDAGLNGTTNTLPAVPQYGFIQTASTSTIAFVPAPKQRVVTAGGQNIYLVGLATFASGTSSANGFIRAVRVA